MTTLSDARRAYREALSKYQERTPSRTAILGDGRGTATENVIVPGRPDYVYARDDVTSTRFFQVLNQGAVQPAANLPVYIGYPFPTGSGSDEEQVIRINYSGLGGIDSGTVPSTGPHHQQHEFRGGDDILLDSRQFLPGLVHPTDPISMKVQVESFIYFWDTWQRREIVQSKNLNEYLPDSGYVRWVLIGLDPETGELVYRPGVPFATGAQDVILGTFTPVPAPAGNELPLGYVRLLSTTISIDWTTSADNIADARLWVNPPMLNILDRLKQLEGLSGNPPDLMMMGSASASDSGDNTLNGLADVDTAGVTANQTLAYSNGLWRPSNAGSGTLTGSGTSTNIPKWTASTILGNSIMAESVDTLTITITQNVGSASTPKLLHIIGGAHTSLSSGVEAIDVDFNLARTVQWATNNIATQRAVVFRAPTYAFLGASTITTAATVTITDAPAAGTFATITNTLAFWVQSGRIMTGSAEEASNYIDELHLHGTVTTTASRAVAAGFTVASVLTASANSDGLYGLSFVPTFAKGAFTGLVTGGILVAPRTPTGAGTIATYFGVRIVEQTIATANIGVLVGSHPGGSTNYSMYLNSSNALFLGSGAVRLDNQNSTGANTATFTATNKPGSGVTLTPQTWLKINLGGTDYYLPCFI